MQVADLSNSIVDNEVVLWQYDQAHNLIALVEKWNDLGTVIVEKFWDYLRDGILAVDTADAFGLEVLGRLNGIGWPVIDNKVSGKKEKISNDFFRRIIKSRFLMSCKRPSVKNYNDALSILFPDYSNPIDIEGEILHYSPRNRVLDNGLSTGKTMSMGFTFPTDATDEEAYMIFQHADTLYRYPAGICTRDVFVREDRTIGFSGQGLNNFANGFVWADETDKNGGIVSVTPGSNYKDDLLATGKAFVIDADSGDTVSVTLADAAEVWIDWGDGFQNYYSGDLSYSHTYSFDGRYAIAVRYDLTVQSASVSGTVKDYQL